MALMPCEASSVGVPRSDSSFRNVRVEPYVFLAAGPRRAGDTAIAGAEADGPNARERLLPGEGVDGAGGVSRVDDRCGEEGIELQRTRELSPASVRAAPVRADMRWTSLGLSPSSDSLPTAVAPVVVPVMGRTSLKKAERSRAGREGVPGEGEGLVERGWGGVKGVTGTAKDLGWAGLRRGVIRGLGGGDASESVLD
jgi:hypothetical protein